MGGCTTRSLFASVLAIIAALFIAPSPASAQTLTEAMVIQTCAQTKALPDGSWTYRVSHVDWANLEWGVQNPFPGRNAGDVWIEITVSADPVFSCTPVDGQGQNPLNLPVFNVLAPVRGFAVGDDLPACEGQNGQSIMVLAYPGLPCPFAEAAGFAAVVDYAAPGPYATITSAEGPACTIFRPEVLNEAGLRHPIVIWGNGTNATPSSYAALLTHLASHGFVVAAANTTSAGSGQAMLACLDYLQTQHVTPGTFYYKKLNPFRIGASGHSQGAGGSIMAGRDNRVGTTAPINPADAGLNYQPGAESAQNGPMLLLSAGSDVVNPPAEQGVLFGAANVPVFWATLAGASHLEAGGAAGRYRGPVTAWLRWQLMRDPAAATVFEGPGCSICVSSDWTVQKKGLP